MTSTDMVGQVLADKYEIIAYLRSGKYGDFWHARRLKDQTDVAIKLLKQDLFADGHAIVRFERETRVLRKFHHPNLLRVEDHGRTPAGSPFLVTEYKVGRLLSDEIGELSLTIEKVCNIGMQMAAVLAAAHTQGIVHRGLNPEVILLCAHQGDPDHVKVLDFGLAHLTEASGEAPLTRIGQRLGRPEYLAPEYIQAQALDARSDVYVLGILTFEMLCGQPPFVGPKRSVFDKQLKETPWTPSEISELEVPEWLDALVLACLAKNPDDRPQSGLAVTRSFIYRKHPL